MRLVIITHGYSPALNARAFRWTALAEYWAAAGHAVEVVTVRSGNMSSGEVVNGVRIHRVGFYLEKLGVAARQSGREVLGGKGAERGASWGWKRSFVRVAKKVHDLTWKRIYWPDYAAPWIPFAAIAAARVISARRPTAVISVSLPFSSHLAALLAGVVRRGIPWIVDIGDPFSFAIATPTNNHALYAGLNARSERAVFGKASAVTVTTPATASAYTEVFGERPGMMVIPPMLSISAKDLSEPGHFVEDPPRLVYVGTLDRNIRNPDRLLAIFDALVSEGEFPDLQLDFYGESGNCGESFAKLTDETSARVKIHGLVSRDAAFDATRSALAVINIGNSTTLQLPSKLVEYVASGRPIVNLTSGRNDSSTEFLAGVPGVLALERDVAIAEAARMLAEFLRESMRPHSYQARASWLAGFSVEAVASAYEELIVSSRNAGVENGLAGPVNK